MTAIGPGDWVECVNDTVGARGVRVLSMGGIYCVSAVQHKRQCGLRKCQGGCLGLHLKEVAGELPWCATRFRPIYRPKADLIERLMEPVPDEPVKVKA